MWFFNVYQRLNPLREGKKRISLHFRLFFYCTDFIYKIVLHKYELIGQFKGNVFGTFGFFSILSKSVLDYKFLTSNF